MNALSVPSTETTMTTAQYPVLPLAAGTLARVFAVLLAPVVLSSKAVVRAMRNRHEANVLARLDRHMLADIGLTRSDVHDAFSTPLWEDPTALLSERAIERRMHRAVLRTAQRKGADNAFKQPPANRPACQTV
jgi:uncharacterized protein YjiS (DUF1127 family)